MRNNYSWWYQAQVLYQINHQDTDGDSCSKAESTLRSSRVPRLVGSSSSSSFPLSLSPLIYIYCSFIFFNLNVQYNLVMPISENFQLQQLKLPEIGASVNVLGMNQMFNGRIYLNQIQAVGKRELSFINILISICKVRYAVVATCDMTTQFLNIQLC